VSDQIAMWRHLYDGWTGIAARFGHVQTQVILGLFYAFIIGPVSIGIALSRGDLLAKRRLGERASAWRAADSTHPELERARHQF